MKIKKIISLLLVSVILMCSAAMAVSAIEVQDKCPKCGGSIMWFILRESTSCLKIGVLVEDCMSCDYMNTTDIPGTHKDENSDNKCDKCGQRIEEEKVPEVPETPEAPDEPETPDNNDSTSDSVINCTCNCHKSGIIGLFYKLVIFIQKLFGQNKVCACGVGH